MKAFILTLTILGAVVASVPTVDAARRVPRGEADDTPLDVAALIERGFAIGPDVHAIELLDPTLHYGVRFFRAGLAMMKHGGKNEGRPFVHYEVEEIKGNRVCLWRKFRRNRCLFFFGHPERPIRVEGHWLDKDGGKNRLRPWRTGFAILKSGKRIQLWEN